MTPAQRIRHAFIARARRFLAALDAENVSNFQIMYYVIFISAGMYLAFGAVEKPQSIEPVMGELAYHFWVAFNIICPAMTLWGRRLTHLAANAEVGRPNPGYAGAWFQLGGDLGVWGTVIIYLACVLATTAWGEAVYAVFFVFMGVPGGAMFALRSARRIVQIKALEKRLS